MQALTIELPPSELRSIVIVSGPALRHQYVALRVQAEFPHLVAAWLRVPASFPAASPGPIGPPGRKGRVLRVALGVLFGTSALEERGCPSLSLSEVEDRILGEDVKRLRERCSVQPIDVDQTKKTEALSKVERLEAYFVLFVGAGMYWEQAFHICARGLALSQRDGWLPEYGGPYPILWAFYHRDLSRIGSTIQITPSGEGPRGILRRATACLAVDDTVRTCLVRCAALGADLMCETVAKLIASRRICALAPYSTGAAVTSADQWTADVKADVERLLDQGFIRQNVARYQTF